MTVVVTAARLPKRRRLPGFFYRAGDVAAHPEVMTGAEWARLVTDQRLQLRNNGDGSLGAFARIRDLGGRERSELQFEIYEDGIAPDAAKEGAK